MNNPESSRKLIQEKKEKDIFEHSFEQDGLTVELAKEKAHNYIIFNETNKKYWDVPELTTHDPAEKAQKTKDWHSDSFYLNTSDAIFALDRIKAEDEQVLCIAASGDTSQIFINNGAKSVELCDVSLPGILYNELKLAALRTLKFADYKKMFDIDENTENWLDPEIYDRLRPLLSTQARTFFDIIVEYPKKDSKLLHRSYWSSEFMKRRENLPIGSVPFSYPQTIGSIVNSSFGFGHGDYALLQEKAKTAEVSIHWRDINDYGTKYDIKPLVYISNLGYNPGQTAEIAKTFLGKGAKRVVFSVDCDRTVAVDTEPGKVVLYEPKYRESTSEKSEKKGQLPPMTSRTTRSIFQRNDKNIQETRVRFRQNPCIFEIGGLNARILGNDAHLLFNLMFEASAKDNPNVT